METVKEHRGFERSLHTVHKGRPSKPWKKLTTSCPPPSHLKVYKVSPVDFKELVQKFTGANAPLRAIALSPLDVDVVPAEALPGRDGDIISKERDGSMIMGMSDVSRFGAGLGLGLSVSPGWWFQFPVSSPVRCTETTAFL